MKKLIKTFAFLALILFSFIGMFFTSTVLHELSHKQDYSIFTDNDFTCFFGIEKNITLSNWFMGKIGYYLPEFNPNSNTTKIENIDKYTEKKAYSISFLIMIIWAFVMIVEIATRIKNKDKIDFYNYFESWYNSKVIKNHLSLKS